MSHKKIQVVVQKYWQLNKKVNLPPFPPRRQNHPPLSVQCRDRSSSIAPVWITRDQSVRTWCRMFPNIIVTVNKYLQHARDDPVLNNANSIPESSCKGVHGSDVSDEQVLQVCGLPAHFSIKVQASWLQAALFNDGLEEIRRWRITRITRLLYHCSDLYSSC